MPATATAAEARAASRSRSNGNSRPIRSISRTSPTCAIAESTADVFGVSMRLDRAGIEPAEQRRPEDDAREDLADDRRLADLAEEPAEDARRAR